MDSIETTPNPRVRAAVAICHDESILLVCHEKAGRRYWLLPGGGIDFGEPAHQAARREVLEETGLEIEMGQLLLVNETLAPDGSRHLLHLTFAGTLTGGHLRPSLDPRVCGARWVPLDELAGVTLHPPLAPQLLEALDGGYGHRDRFLGNLWVD
ncbi:MAG: NUDIX domain-containing protein [Vulcanimicrobiota bacterium]